MYESMNYSNNCIVSIIMPTYNRGYIISKAIESVINQSYAFWELVIVDDGSVDNTNEIVAKYTQDQRIKYIRYEYNKGGNYARNLGLKNIKGEYISFLDTDNTWEKDYLIKKIKILKDYNVDFTFSGSIIYTKDGIWNFPDVSKEILNDRTMISKIMCKKNVIDTNTICMKKKCYTLYGGFDENFKRLQDWEYFFRLIVVNGVSYIYEDCKLTKGEHQINSISNKIDLFVEARSKLINKHYDKYKELGCIYDGIMDIFSHGRLFDVCNGEFLALFNRAKYDIDMQSILLKEFEKKDKELYYMQYYYNNINSYWTLCIKDCEQFLNYIYEEEKLILYGNTECVKIVKKYIGNLKYDGDILVLKNEKIQHIYNSTIMICDNPNAAMRIYKKIPTDRNISIVVFAENFFNFLMNYR